MRSDLPRFLRIATGAALAASLAFGPAASALAQPVGVGPDDTIEKLLAAHKGKRVTLKLGPGDEITGLVRAVTPSVVRLSELAGREFFDAIVDVRAVRAIIVRTRN